ncbi:MAG: FemAB family XrtA/PEP-CTERM system-associated protein [Planctomycetota bacterium]
MTDASHADEARNSDQASHADQVRQADQAAGAKRGKGASHVANAASDGPLVSIVIAITENEAHPRTVIEGFGRALLANGYPCEFVVVLDGPHRRFDEELRELSQRWTVHTVALEGGGLGESIALSAGVAKARGELVVNAPPYLQIEPEDVVDVVKALEAGADCVATWRDRRVDPWLNQMQSRLFNRVLRVIMDTPFHDLNSGTRGFRRQVLEEVAVYGELYRFLPVLAARQGFRVVEVRVRHREEKGRAGFYGIGVYLRRLLDIAAITFLTRFTQRPLRFFGYLGFAAIAIGAPIALWYLYDRLVNGESLADKPAFVIGAILAAFGVQLIGFGLIGEIIIFTQAPNLRDYKVDEEISGDGSGGRAGDFGEPSGIAEGSRESAGDAIVPDIRQDPPPSSSPQPSSPQPGSPQPTESRPQQGRSQQQLAGTAAEDRGHPPKSVSAGDEPVEEKMGDGLPQVEDELPGMDGFTPRSEEHTLVTVPADIAVHDGVRIRAILPGEDARWDSFVRRHPQGTFFHRTGWSRAVQEQFRHEPHHLVAEQGRRWLGVLPLFLTKSPFLGKNLVSVPYSVYGGVLANDEATNNLLVARARSLGEDLGVGFVEMRHLEQRPGDLPESELYVTYRCDLPDDPAEVMARIPKKRRAEVRAAREPKGPASKKKRESFGLTVTADGSIEELFALFAENKRRLGSPSLPISWFQSLQDEFGKAAVIHRAVEPGGRTIAAVMSFTFKDTVYAYYSGSRTDVNHTGVNNFIYCAIMEWAVENGYRRFDFGRSRAKSGPARFKENMGFKAEQLHYQYALVGKNSKLPEFHPSNPKLALPRRVWSKMPMMVCNRLGAKLSRYLP